MNYKIETAFLYWTADVWMVFSLAIFLSVAAYAAYCRSVQRLVATAAPANRSMKPWQAWLLLIPFFNVVFAFMAARRLSVTIREEAISRGIPVGSKPTYRAGLALAITGAMSYLPVVGWIGGIGCVVCWILHWVQVVEWCGKLRCENPVSACERVLYEHRTFGA